MPQDATQKRNRAPVDVFKYRDYRAFLAAYYEHKKPAGLSYRGFAKLAGLGAPNYLKLVIDGQRNLSAEMAERFARACKLNADATEYFKVLVALGQAKDDAERNVQTEKLAKFARFRASQRLDLAQKDYHSTWYIPAIRELVACPGFVEDPEWIAATLRPAIAPKQAAHALSVLTQLGMVERGDGGKLEQSTRAVSTGAQATGLYVRNYHAQMMERAALAMQEIPAAERDISALTLSVSEQTFAEVQRRLIALRSELCALCDSDPNPTKILQLNLQLFPLSHSVNQPPEKK